MYGCVSVVGDVVIVVVIDTLHAMIKGIGIVVIDVLNILTDDVLLIVNSPDVVVDACY